MRLKLNLITILEQLRRVPKIYLGEGRHARDEDGMEAVCGVTVL